MCLVQHKQFLHKTLHHLHHHQKLCLHFHHHRFLEEDLQEVCFLCLQRHSQVYRHHRHLIHLKKHYVKLQELDYENFHLYHPLLMY